MNIGGDVFMKKYDARKINDGTHEDVKRTEELKQEFEKEREDKLKAEKALAEARKKGTMGELKKNIEKNKDEEAISNLYKELEEKKERDRV